MRELGRRHRALMGWVHAIGVVAVVGAVGCARVAAAPDPSPKASPSPSAPIVPWLALSSGHQYAEAPEVPPTPPLAVPPNTPQCTASQIEGASFYGGAGGGHVNIVLLLHRAASS
jgi:hypothetical protein